jgi:molybdopterin converting factor small subunit
MSDKETTQIDFPSKFDDAQKEIKALKSTMDEEASSLFEERKEFEEMRKKLDSVHFEKHIKLNVGDLIFKTSLDTLVKDSDSMLAAMFSSRFDVKPDEEDGAYFIDRDGTNFRKDFVYIIILNIDDRMFVMLGCWACYL